MCKALTCWTKIEFVPCSQQKSFYLSPWAEIWFLETDQQPVYSDYRWTFFTVLRLVNQRGISRVSERFSNGGLRRDSQRKIQNIQWLRGLAPVWMKTQIWLNWYILIIPSRVKCGSDANANRQSLLPVSCTPDCLSPRQYYWKSPWTVRTENA